jgi:Family of unknown function (DUF6011)
MAPVTRTQEFAMAFARITTDFSDLDDSLDGVAILTAAQPEPDFLQDSVNMARSSAVASRPCPRCRGSGSAFGGVCFRCNGRKAVAALSTAPKSVAARARVVEARVNAGNDLAARIAEFTRTHADCIEYVYSLSNDFGASCLQKLRIEGAMTPNQVAAIRRALDQNKQRAAARTAAAPSVAGAGFTKLLDSFKHARESGLKRPKMICGDLTLKLATEESKNPGCVYVYHGKGTALYGDRIYIGKITPEGKFLAASDATPQDIAEVERIGLDPFKAAVDHGRLTGNCSICSRKLTDPASVAAGIGPICAGKMSW